MSLKEELINVSFATLKDIRDELKSTLNSQEKRYMRELNEYQSVKYQLKLYENEISRRLKDTEEYV